MYRSLQNKSCVSIGRTQNAPEGADYVNRLGFDGHRIRDSHIIPLLCTRRQAKPSARHAVSLRGFDVPACQKSRKTPSVRRFVGTGKNCWHKIGLYRPVRQPLRNCREKGDRSTRSQEAQERNPVALPAEERAVIDSKVKKLV
jgi:hypothetical protein